MRRRTDELRQGTARHREQLRGIARARRDVGWRRHLLSAFRAEDRDRDRAPLREIIAVDARTDLVAQPDRLGPLHEAALRALLDQREATAPLAQEIRRARAVGEQRLRARQ